MIISTKSWFSEFKLSITSSNIISGLGQKSLCPMDAQTAGPIVPKFGMGIQEHLEIAIGYVLCTWVQGGRREGRRKGGGQIGLMLLA